MTTTCLIGVWVAGVAAEADGTIMPFDIAVLTASA
jgi:hypothetical protein